MNGIENASVLISHAMERMTADPEIHRTLVVFEPNRDYVNKVIGEQLDFMSYKWNIGDLGFA